MVPSFIVIPIEGHELRGQWSVVWSGWGSGRGSAVLTGVCTFPQLLTDSEDSDITSEESEGEGESFEVAQWRGGDCY